MDTLWWIALGAVVLLALIASVVDGTGRLGPRAARRRRRHERRHGGTGGRPPPPGGSGEDPPDPPGEDDAPRESP